MDWRTKAVIILAGTALSLPGCAGLGPFQDRPFSSSPSPVRSGEAQAKANEPVRLDPKSGSEKAAALDSEKLSADSKTSSTQPPADAEEKWFDLPRTLGVSRAEIASEPRPATASNMPAPKPLPSAMTSPVAPPPPVMPPLHASNQVSSPVTPPKLIDVATRPAHHTLTEPAPTPKSSDEVLPVVGVAIRKSKDCTTCANTKLDSIAARDTAHRSVPRAKPSGTQAPAPVADGISLTDSSTLQVVEGMPPLQTDRTVALKPTPATTLNTEPKISAVADLQAETTPEQAAAEQPSEPRHDSAVVPASAKEVAESPAESTKVMPLELAELHLCTEILGFGKTAPLANSEFSPGQQLLAYVEVRNFTSVLKGVQHETLLGGEIVLVSEEGKVAFRHAFADVADRCHAQRHDFFCHFVFDAPADIAPGAYKLKLTILDRHSGRRCQQGIDVRVSTR